MLCEWKGDIFSKNKKIQKKTTGCDEGIADSLDGLLDTAGAPVELVESGLHWVQPMDYYIHVSRLRKWKIAYFEIDPTNRRNNFHRFFIVDCVIVICIVQIQAFLVLSLSTSHAYEQIGEWIGCFWEGCKDNKPRFPSKVFLKMICL